MSPRKILIVDDESKVLQLIKTYFEKADYIVYLAGDGQKAIEQAQLYKPDIMILDLNLPGIDGLEVCRTIRKTSQMPIIMLTARDDELDKIVGLELGADDYVTKPFSPRELVARTNAVMRRYREEPINKGDLIVGDIRLSPAKHQATFAEQILNLTASEFKLLSVLAENPDMVFSRTQLMDMAFDVSFQGYERTIDAHIKNIRHKLYKAAPDKHNPLVTVRGVGYKLEKCDTFI